MDIKRIEQYFPFVKKVIRLISILSIITCLLSVILFFGMLLSSDYSNGSYMIGYIPAYALIWGIIPCSIMLIILAIYLKYNQKEVWPFLKREIKLLGGSILAFAAYMLTTWITAFWIIPYE